MKPDEPATSRTENNEMNQTPSFPQISPISRAAYEAVCAANGFRVWPDDDLASLADRYSFTTAGSAYTSLSHAGKLEMHNRLARGEAVLPEYTERRRRYYTLKPAPFPAPPAGGQIWEECPHCGQEPVYMPRMVCRDCSEKGAAA